MTDSPARDYLNALRVKKAEEFHSAGGERVAQASYCNDAERLTDSVSEIVEEVDELCLDDQILSALDYPDICSKSLPKCNGKSVNSKHCATAVVSSGEGDDDSEEEETFQGYMPLPQDSDEDPDTYGGSLVMMNRADFGGDLSHQQCGTKQDVLCGAGGKDLGGAGAAKPSALGEEEVEVIKQAMSGFSLPASAVPEWAKHISEDVWKSELVQGLHTKQVKKE